MPKYQKEKITLTIKFILQNSNQVMKNVKWRSIMVLWLLAVACGTEEPSLYNTDSNYFPLKVGSQWVYTVEETSISRNNCTDDGTTLYNYEIQVLVSDSFSNTDKSLTYILQRAKRLTPNDAWIPTETWTATIASNQVITSESNIKYVSLVFPISEGLTWNGNLYNNRIELNGQNEDQYKITSVGKPYINSEGFSYDKTISVIQNDQQSNLLYRDSRSEVYAFNTGLVYKESYLLNYFSDSRLPCFGQNKVQRGRILKQSLKEYSR
jgi:hypothetical protein